VTVSFSQELVNPPDNPSGGAVWVQRYPDNTPVQTSTGFGSLYSSQAAFGAPVENYMAKVYAGMAALMAAASLAARLQFGEVLWWYQANTVGMRSTMPTPRRRRKLRSAARWRPSTRRMTTRP